MTDFLLRAFQHIDLPSSRVACGWIVTKTSTGSHVAPVKLVPHINTARTCAFPNTLQEEIMRVPFALAFLTIVGLTGTLALADEDEGIGKIKIGVPNAVTPVTGVAQPTLIDPDFTTRVVAKGTDPLENPSGTITKFGLLSTSVPTEPDQNTYVRFAQNPGGPTPGFNYGHNFLYQGHENAGNIAYVTRINLDVADPAHRITLLTPVGQSGLT